MGHEKRQPGDVDPGTPDAPDAPDGPDTQDGHPEVLIISQWDRNIKRTRKSGKGLGGLPTRTEGFTGVDSVPERVRVVWS